MLIQATVTAKNQITIPKAVRDLLKLKQADNVQFKIDANNKVSLEKQVSKQTFWNDIQQQAKKYGSVDTAELDWGEPIGKEIW